MPGPSEAELELRISAHARHAGGQLPDRAAVAWKGYLAAAVEWGLISLAAHDRLTGLLPAIADDPTEGILLGHHDAP